jgi:hypothetical protein
VRQHYQVQAAQRREPAPSQRHQQAAPEERSSRPQEIQRSSPQQQGDRDTRRAQPQQRGGDNAWDSTPSKAPSQQRGSAVEERRQDQGVAQRERQTPRSSQEFIQPSKGSSQEPGRGQDRDRANGKEEERSRERNR